ncbi:helix-turn-helix domain-containing protein [Paenibacillus sp. HJGM_3]|uniref:helix-turn-helix domain-containing protein n=1 Tax=Paenibacillus sp. HJGM_3 TaxID=3379816 RepID=UPI0038586F29
MKAFHSFIHNIPFKRKLMLFSLLLSIGPVLIVGFSSSYITARTMQAEVNAHHASALNQMQFQMNNLIKSLHITSIRLATNLSLEKSVLLGPSIDNLNQTLEVSEAIRREMSLSTFKFNVSLVYPQNSYVYTTATEANKLSGAQARELVAQSKPLYNSAFMVLPDPDRNREDLLLFRPVPLATSYTEGILVLHVSVHELVKFLTALSESTESKIFIVDSSGSVIVSRDTRDIGTRLNLYPAGAPADSVLSEALPRHYNLDGTDYTVSSQSSQFADWSYIIVTPSKALTQRSDSIRAITWTIVAGIAALWVLVALFGSHRLYFPIARILQKSLASVAPGSAQPTGDGLKALDSFIETMVSTNRELKQELHDQSPYLQMSLLQQLLLGEMSEAQIADKIARFRLPIKGTLFCVAIVAVDQHKRFIHKYKERDRTLIHYAMRKMIEELCGDEFSCLTTVSQPGSIAVLIGVEPGGGGEANRLPRRLDDIRLRVSEYYQFTVSVAASSFRHGYTSIHEGYQEAQNLLRRRLTLGPDSTILDGAEEGEGRLRSPNYSELQKSIVTHVIHGNLEEAEAQLSELIDGLPENIRSAEAATGAIAYLLGELDYMLHRLECKLDDVLEADAYKELYAQTTIQEVRDWLAGTVFPAVKRRLDAAAVTRQERLVQQVLHYLGEQAEANISLQLVAEEFRISPSHLSRMFKEQTGKTFSDYLLEHRMHRAKEWLTHTSMPIKDIADQLSYTNVTNFTRAYKQFFGTSPGKYRSRTLSE